MRINPVIIIRKLKANNGKMRKTARDLGISPTTVSNWRMKAKMGAYRTLKFKGLKRKSTKPKSSRQTILKSYEQDQASCFRRKTGFCAKKIQNMLKLPYHHITIHRFLKRKGLIQETGNYRRPLFQNTKHMHAKNVKTLGKLQMDVKYVTPELSGLEHTCYLYGIIDILSRYKQGIIFPLLDQEYSIEAVKYLMPALPLEVNFIQTDNGLEFQKRFTKYVKKEYSLKHHYIHKSNPNENAVIERSFRTDQDEFFYFRLRRKGKPRDILELNLFYQEFIKEYNELRPHLSLEMMTPLEKIKSVQ